MSQNHNDADSGQPEAPGTSSEQPAVPVPESGAPTQPLYGQYGTGAHGTEAPASGDQPAYGQGPYGQPGYGQAPSPYGYPAYPAPAPNNPGKTMGIVGLILSCLFFIPFASLVGVILSIVAFVQSRKAKMANGPALAGIIIGAVVFLLTLLATILIFVFAVDQLGSLIEICEDRGPGRHLVGGEVYECYASGVGQSL